jgi:hypothetical protein
LYSSYIFNATNKPLYFTTMKDITMWKKVFCISLSSLEFKWYMVVCLIFFFKLCFKFNSFVCLSCFKYMHFFQMAVHLLEYMEWRPLSCSSWLRLFRVYNYNDIIVAAFMRNPNTYFKCYTINWWHTNVLPDLQDITDNRLFWNILRTILIGQIQLSDDVDVIFYL